MQLPIRCPFCNALEDERVSGIDENGEKVILLMFDCPFFYRFPVERLGSDESIQNYLNEWRIKEGESWLDSIGPVMKARELRNMERFRSSSAKT